jgi:hypothetical protein
MPPSPRRRRRTLSTLVLGLTLLATAMTGARAADIDPAGPKGAMKSFYEAMEASDAAAVRASFHAANEDEKQLADAYAGLLTAAKALGDAAKAKFAASGDALSKGMPVKDEIAKLKAAEETITGNTATLKVNPKGKPFRLVKSEGRWRLSVSDYAGATPENIQGQITVLRDMAATFTAITADITGDKFPTANDAQRALQQKLQAVVYNTLKKSPPTSAPTATKPK